MLFFKGVAGLDKPSRQPAFHRPAQENRIGQMSDGTEQRKLAAIMFTDMVGYPDPSGAPRNEALAPELLTRVALKHQTK